MVRGRRLCAFGALVGWLFVPAGTAFGQTLVAHWALNATSGTSAVDSSGSGYTGTVTGTSTWVAGYIGNGFQFNGATKIQIPGLLGNPANISVAAWVNLTNADSNGAEVVSLGDHFLLRLDAGTQTHVALYNGSAWIVLALNQTFEGTGWHHFAATFDDAANSLRLYVDGSLSQSLTTSSSISYAGLGSNTVIGRHGVSQTTVDFTGIIDDVRVYDYAISAGEVAELYSAVGRWKLGETSGTAAADSSIYVNNGTVTGGAAWSTRCSGTGVFDFNGSSQYVLIPNKLSLQPTSRLTLAAWIKGDTWGSASDVDSIIRKGEASPNNYQLAIQGGKVVLHLDQSDGAGTLGNTVLTTGQWYHVAATWDGSLVRVYVDGVLDNAPAARSGTIAVDTRPLYVGGRSGADLFDGMIYDARIYRRALSQAEIAELFGVVGNWTLSQTSGTVATDASPATNNGTYTNSVTLGGVGPMTGTVAATFDGVNDYVRLPADTSDYSNGLTIAAWARPTSTGAWARFADFGGGQDQYNFFLTRNGTTTTLEFALHGGTLVAPSASAKRYIRATNAIVINEWHHYVSTVSSAGVAKLYRDGAELAISSGSAGYPTIGLPVSVTRDSNFIARSNWGADAYYRGQMWDVRVYNRCLCPAELQALYNLGSSSFAGVKIIKWVELQ